MKKHGIFYILIISVFGAALWAVLSHGKGLETSKAKALQAAEIASHASTPSHFFSNLQENVHHPLAVLIIQIFCIMIVARIFGYLMTRIGQPSVVGEIMAGITLGPSLMGFIFPEFSAFLFPEESLRRLHVLSQIGLVLFMFIIGMELDISVLKKKASSAVIVSHASIVFPYFLGVALAYYLYTSFAPANVPFSAFALFMGIAMSITAFPVLARIVQERGLTHTPLGTVVITCAAADDITAWCLLALVVAIVSAGGMISAVGSISLSIIYILIMWFAVRPLLNRMAIKYDTPESIDKSVVAAIFGILLLSSYLTEIIGIHALFGAFLAGVSMPQQKEFKRILSEKIEDVSLVLLLPLFFVFTGLRTQIGLLNQANLWGVCLLIIAVAVIGKFVGSAVAARFTGQSWKDSLLIGILMNTRGLMELVVLNIGYDLGVISAEIFTMMVLMALVTTFMTGPSISLIEMIFKPKPVKAPREGFNALISFGSPRSGERLMEVAHYLNFKNEKDGSISVAHFSPSADISIIEAEEYERDAFTPLERTAERFGISLKKIFRVTDNPVKEILETAKENPYDIILLGSSRELFKDSKTGGMVRSVIHQSRTPVGVFIDKDLKKIENVFVVISAVEDLFLLKFTKKFMENNGAKNLVIWDQLDLIASKNEVTASIDPQMKKYFVSSHKLVEENKELDKRFDLVLVSFNLWDNLKRKQGHWMKQMPSILIIHQ